MKGTGRRQVLAHIPFAKFAKSRSSLLPEIPLTPRNPRSTFLLPPDVGPRIFPKEIVSRPRIFASQNQETNEACPRRRPQPIQATLSS